MKASEGGQEAQEGAEDGGDAGERTLRQKINTAVEPLEAYFGTVFGTPAWYAVLILCVAICGGGYYYLILNYADFSDIPILNGPKL